MLIINGNRRLVGDVPAHIARLEALIVGLERFANGELPTGEELEAAPVITPYTLAVRPSVCLVGGNGGHPYLKGRAIRTSKVWIMAPELGWARTYSRLYRLGEPITEVQP